MPTTMNWCVAPTKVNMAAVSFSRSALVIYDSWLGWVFGLTTQPLQGPPDRVGGPVPDDRRGQIDELK